jgi:hypothetical protein
MFCDLYFAVNDNTCVNQIFKKLNVNMYDYLMVSSIHSVISLFIVFIYITTININDNNNCLLLLSYIIGIFNKIFITVWTIIGSVIFWHFMNNNDCSNTVYNYLFTSLIIKIVLTSIGNTQDNNSKK